MILRRFRILWLFVLFMFINLLAAGCANSTTTTALQEKTTISSTEGTASTSDSQMSTESSSSNQTTNSATTPIPSPTQSSQTSTQVNGTLQVHYIDVGQADSILIKDSDGTAVLIDGGNNPDGPDVVNYLKSQQVKE